MANVRFPVINPYPNMRTIGKFPHFPAVSLLAFVSLACTAVAAEDRVQSGLQTGEAITSIFEPLNINGPFAGEPHCLVCENGGNPVAMIFAREISAPLLQLLAKLDAATARHRQQEMGSFAVFLNDAEALPERLKDAARRHSLQHLVLAIDEPTGPEGFNVAPEAEVTVVLYRDYNVKANHAFRKGELNDQAVEKIVADLPKILTVEQKP